MAAGIVYAIAGAAACTVVAGVLYGWRRASWIGLAAMVMLAAYQLVVIASLLGEYERNTRVRPEGAGEVQACVIPSAALKAYAVTVDPALTAVIDADPTTRAVVSAWIDAAVTDVVRVTTSSGKVGGLHARFKAVQPVMIRSDVAGAALVDDVSSGRCRYVIAAGHVYLAVVPTGPWAQKIQGAFRESRSDVLRRAANDHAFLAMARVHPSNIVKLPAGAQVADYGNISVAAGTDSVVNRMFTDVIPSRASGGEVGVTLLGYGLASSAS